MQIAHNALKHPLRFRATDNDVANVEWMDNDDDNDEAISAIPRSIIPQRAV